jgi:mannose-6-phosphate isomerase
MVWGGRCLAESLGKSLPAPGPYGESWDLSDHPLHRSVAATGPRTGRSLRELMEHDALALLGPAAGRHAVFPWLVKFLDARDWLSVQVHPDERAVRRLWPGEGPKTEAWFVLAADPGSRVYAGLVPGTDERRLRASLAMGKVAECLHAFEPRPGDCLFLPAGTVHAVGGGVLMAEVQQTSDATFRLYDWDRKDAQGSPRQLHVEQALACIDWARGPVSPVRVEAFTGPRSELPRGPRRTMPLVRCPFFSLEFVQESSPFVWGGTGGMQVLVLLQGHGRLETPTGAEEVAAGQVWLLPARMVAAECRPHGALAALRCRLPSDQ